MKLIVGLGNPGTSYASHRHNVGFMIIDELARRYQLTVGKKSLGALIEKNVISDQDVLLAKPQEYMNCSGKATQALASYYKVELADILVIHDDLDLEFGQIKFNIDRGHGGHNGIRSLIESLGSKSFARLRVGVGRPTTQQDPADFVLTAFAKNEQVAAKDMLSQAATAVEEFLKDGLSSVQQKYH